MESKIILDLCGGSGAWSKPYLDAGYDVRLVTQPDNDVRSYQPPENVYGILAAPPCTMFSLARTRAKTPRDLRQGMETVEACLKIIWAVRCRQFLKFWALENPRGFLRQLIGRPSYTFKPCEFGDNTSKVTDLWGYFNEPKKLKKPAIVSKGCHRASMYFDNPGMGINRADARAITPVCFAKAFFEANK